MEYFALFQITVKKTIPQKDALALASNIIQSPKMKETIHISKYT